ncbi:MAG TPA: dihydroneopterin aldolase [Chitinophagales bacterium]|nr:dihydroneopterin aldolase [Chitinophagales bacterium]
MRTIGLEGMRFHALIGFHPEEKILGNEIEVSIYVTINSGELKEDQLEETLDYMKVHDTVKIILEEKMNLLETACNKIQLAVAALSNDVIKVKVRVTKIHPPVAGRIEKIFVEDEWIR